MKIATAAAAARSQQEVQIANAFTTLYHQFNGQLDCRVCGHLLQQCINHRNGLARQGKQIHAHIVLNSVTPQSFLASKLINFYSKTDHLVEARKVFDQIPHKNIFSWNAMFIAYSIHEKHKQTLKLFYSLVKVTSSTIDQIPPLKPDNFTITCVLKALMTLFPDSKIAKVIHGFVLQHGYFCDIFVVNALVKFYAKSGDFGFARRLFDTTSEKDIVTWNSMISAYSHGGLYEECLDLYREMVGSVGLIPNEVTMVSVLQACAESNNLAFGSEVHRYIIDNNIKVDAAVCNTIIRFYAKCGNLDYARELFDEMDDRDFVSYGSMISSYMNHGFVEKAMELFRELQVPELSTWNAVLSGLVQNNLHDGIPELIQEMQAKGCRPNAVTLSSVLPTFSHFSQLKAGKQIHCYVIRNSYDGNIYVASALIDLYGKTGSLQTAHWLFNECRDKSVIIWTSIISAYAAHGDADAALTLFTDMLTCGVKPDPVTFTAVLAACAHAGLVDKAYKIFEAMFPVYGIFPSLEHYACMVGVLSRAGRLYEAKSFILKMPVEPCAKVWGALVSGVSVSGDVELGMFVCDRLFELEPDKSWNYIFLANLYSQAGQWDEAERVREKMRNMGVKKSSGCSWIETSGGLLSFTAGDISRNMEDMNEMLELLIQMMKEEGYVATIELDEENVFCNEST
ncbi:Pentatricopeptide repeat-containing protein [Thalictrum thalictroides]|uniref:Pentatricopeptide repeat-containing protein n=1 Tax=Thalictrum thalictroides TaxID=46969 RepID=A0A7J6X6L7_THATH|nr:Pentatricopeptide repeat-containing protein [Thalictrum thalictroides]